MELLYLYVEQFRGFNQQTFNFSPELQFTTTLNKQFEQSKNYSLQIDLNPDYVHLFDSNILNLTAIVGKNGAGKSTLLHCLKLMSGQFAILTASLIFAIRVKTAGKPDQIKIYYYQGGGVETMTVLNVSIKASIPVKSKYTIKDPIGYKLDKFGFTADKISGLDFKFVDICGAYYSNVFDGHPEQYYEGLENLSTNYRVETFLKRTINHNIQLDRLQQDKKKTIEVFPSFIADYHKQERKLILQFLAYANSRQLNRLPDLPRSVVIYFNLDDYQYLSSGINSGKLSSEKLNKFHELAVKAIMQSEDQYANFINLTLLCTFYYVLRWNPVDIRGLFEDNLESTVDRILKEPRNLFRHLSNLLANVNIASLETPKMNVVKHLLGKRFVNSVNSTEFISRDQYFQGGRTRFEVIIDTRLWPVLSAIDDLSSAEGSSFLDYEWHGGISTGEESILLHYARLYELKGKVKRRPIWLFIDEGDIYYHPKQQKMYLQDLLGVIKLLFGNNDIQIILTTHSPFIVSDLPAQNLIFMKKEDYQCVVVKNQVPSGTFGANIHDLFTDSFFIDGTLMGDFAKAKIQAVIEWCGPKGKLNEAEKMRKTIYAIGEPIIKMKLMELFAKKVGEDTELARLQSQEDYIRERIAQIKKK